MKTLDKKITCREKILTVLRGFKQPLTNEEIRKHARKLYGYSTPQNNTIAKELSFLIKEGKVKSNRVKGKTFSQYKYIG